MYSKPIQTFFPTSITQILTLKLSCITIAWLVHNLVKCNAYNIELWCVGREYPATALLMLMIQLKDI